MPVIFSRNSLCDPDVLGDRVATDFWLHPDKHVALADKLHFSDKLNARLQSDSGRVRGHVCHQLHGEPVGRGDDKEDLGDDAGLHELLEQRDSQLQHGLSQRLHKCFGRSAQLQDPSERERFAVILDIFRMEVCPNLSYTQSR